MHFVHMMTILMQKSTKLHSTRTGHQKVVVGGPGIGHNAISDKQDQQDAQHIEDAEVARQLQLRFGEMQIRHICQTC